MDRIDDKKSHKKGLGSTADATERHAQSKKEATKRFREEKIAKKRFNQNCDYDVNTVDMIRLLNMNSILNDSDPLVELKKLNEIIKRDDGYFYFAYSGIHLEYQNGPFLFSDMIVVRRIINLLSHPNNDTAYNASLCIINIVGQPDDCWTGRLITCGLLPITFKILSNSSNLNIRENLIWMLANMCCDSVDTRDLILKEGIIPIISKNLEHAENYYILGCATFFFKAILSHGNNLPDANTIETLWNIIVNKVMISQFQAHKIEGPCDILKDILIIIKVLVRRSNTYKMAVVNSEQAIKCIQEYSKLEVDGYLFQVASCEILSILVEYENTHEILVTKLNVISNFTYLLATPHSVVREYAGAGLTNLAKNHKCLPHLCDDKVLVTVQLQFENTDVFRVRQNLHRFVCYLAITPNSKKLQNSVYPIMVGKQFVARLCTALTLTGDINLICRALEAIKCLLLWNKTLIKDQLEDFDGLTQLDRMVYLDNTAISEYSNEIMGIIGFGE